MIDLEKTKSSSQFVRSLELPVRLANCLYNERVTCWNDIVQHGPVYWMRVPNFGKLCMANLTAAMERHGVKWAHIQSVEEQAANVLRAAGWRVFPPRTEGQP